MRGWPRRARARRATTRSCARSSTTRARWWSSGCSKRSGSPVRMHRPNCARSCVHTEASHRRPRANGSNAAGSIAPRCASLLMGVMPLIATELLPGILDAATPKKHPLTHAALHAGPPFLRFGLWATLEVVPGANPTRSRFVPPQPTFSNDHTRIMTVGAHLATSWRAKVSTPRMSDTGWFRWTTGRLRCDPAFVRFGDVWVSGSRSDPPLVDHRHDGDEHERGQQQLDR